MMSGRMMYAWYSLPCVCWTGGKGALPLFTHDCLPSFFP